MLKEIVIKAYNYSKEKHKGQKRRFSGLDYFTHPKFVAKVVSDLTDNPELTAAALLHDVVEDTDATITEISTLFGSIISLMVSELTSDDKDELFKKSKAEYLATKMIDMVPGSLTIKLADRYHNVFFLEKDDVPVKFKKKYWSETKSILKILTKMRELNEVQQALVARIYAILKFIEIRYKW